MKKKLYKILILICFTCLQLFAQSNAELIEIGLGSLTGISNNGQYICGSNHPAPPYIWTQSTGRIELPLKSYELFDISDNGTAVGRFKDSSLIINGTPVLRAGYWANGNWTALEGIDTVPPLDFQSFTHTYGINSNGSKTVGMVWLPNWRTQACYWSIPDTGIGLLEKVGGPLVSSRANAISDNGSIIVGWNGGNPSPDRRPFYWNPQPHFIGAFDSTYDVSGDCFGISSNGEVIVGRQMWPFIWNQSTGIQHVVADSTQYWSGQASGISDNGIIVGHVDLGFSNYRAFIKKPGWSDIILIEDYLPDSLGITGYQNWYFAFSNAISANGNLIGLTAYLPGQFQTHSFLLILDKIVRVELNSFTAPSKFTLKQNYPNPFNPSTTIEFNIPEQGLVNLSVYNLLGEKVATLINEVIEGGNHKIGFNASNLASGIYLVKMSSGSISDVIKINLLK